MLVTISGDTTHRKGYCSVSDATSVEERARIFTQKEAIRQRIERWT